MKTLILSTKIFLIMTLLTGVAYPLLVTGIAQVVFPAKANGSLIKTNNQIIGSELIGQSFRSDHYFMSRPSAINYDASCSGASNLSMTNKKLKQQIADRNKTFIHFNQLDSTVKVPSEMVYASGSGLDPHISVNAAMLQVDRIVKTRQLGENGKSTLEHLIKQNADNNISLFGNTGYVNVLKLNIELDKLKTANGGIEK